MMELENKIYTMVQKIERLEVELREAIKDKVRYAYTDNRTGEYTAKVKIIEDELSRTMQLIELLTKR